MNVGEVINALSNYPRDMPIAMYIPDRDYGDWYEDDVCIEERDGKVVFW